MNRLQAMSEALGCHRNELRVQPLSGGCINHAAVICTPHNQFFAKWNDQALSKQFGAEAAGLKALKHATGLLHVPELIAYSDKPQANFLLLEYLPTGQANALTDEQLGYGLAQLHHSTSSEGFGFEMDGYCGTTSQPNTWSHSWVEFFAQRRLGHQLELAHANGLPSPTLHLGEQLIAQLTDRLESAERPALLHGDLWSGNVHITTRGLPALIDPAAYFGHREAELGMMVLFGGFSERVFAAYQHDSPLSPGWQERLPIYSLYHILNHFNLFGGGYAAQAHRILRELVG